MKIKRYAQFINEKKEGFPEPVEMNFTTYDEIKNFLDEQRITNYTINDDLTVSVEYHNTMGGFYGVGFDNRFYGHLPINFDVILGGFWCHENQLTTLKGCPNRISEGFYCQNQYTKELKTLEFGPEIVGKNYICDNVGLTSLYGAPTRIPGGFQCRYNELETLERCPMYIGEDFYLTSNKITHLMDFPEKIGGNIYLENNPLENIDALPKTFDLNKLILSNYNVVWDWLIKIFDEDISLISNHIDWIKKFKNKITPAFQNEYGYILDFDHYTKTL